MSKASDTILKDLFPLYEKWLNQDGISIQQVGLTCLGSAIACLQQAGYSPNEIVQSAIMSVIPRGAKVEYLDTDGNTKMGSPTNANRNEKVKSKEFTGPGTMGHYEDCRCAACRNFDD